MELACPCVSLLDDLSCLEGIANVAPSLRGDDIVAPSEDFLKRLSSLTGISAYDDNGFSNAVKKRLDALEANGLVFTDHALDNGFCFRC